MSEERYPEQMDLCVKVSGETFGLLTDFANLLKVDAGEALGKVLQGFLEQQNAIAWHTSCTNCASLLDRAHKADELYAKADAELAANAALFRVLRERMKETEDRIVSLQAKLRGMGAERGL